jgi:TolB protein
LVQNGKVVKAFALTGDRRKLDAEGELTADGAGWVVLRAWNDGSDPEVLDLYPYATTSPVYLELPGGLPPDPADAAYFVAWLDRVIADAGSRTGYRTARERETTIAYLRQARDHFQRLAASHQWDGREKMVVEAVGLEPRIR